MDTPIAKPPAAKPPAPVPVATLATVLGALALTGVLAAGFYGWMAHGPDLLLAYAERAAAWCF